MASKIKVDTIENVAGSGNVSLGSGHNLVVPGNNSTTGNATVGGDLTVDTNVLKVDSTNNRVGINTTSGPESLNIGSGGNLRFQTTNTVRIEYLNTSGAYALGTTGGAAIGFNRPASGDDEIFFETHNGGVSHAERMRINKDGYVTMPYQPSFMVRGNNGAWVSVSSGATSIIEFDGNTSHNVGNHYSTANDRFVAPVAGRYLFSVNAYVDTGGNSSDSSPYGFVRFRKNGSNIPGVHHIFGYLNAEDHDQICTLTAILELSASDYIQVALQASNGTVRHYGDSSVFYGHLLG